MDADELLARSLQEEEDRAAAAELLRRDASASAVSSQRGDFARRLDGGVRTVLAYEDAEARAAALAVIPVQRLRPEADALVAQAAARAAEETGAEETSSDGSARISDPISDRDALLLRRSVVQARVLHVVRRARVRPLRVHRCAHAVGARRAHARGGEARREPGRRRTRARRPAAARRFGSRGTTTR